MSDQQNLYEDWDNLPEDFDVITTGVSYDPLPADTYQVEILEVSIKDNFFYKPDAPEGKKGFKYSIGTTLVIIEEGEYYGRRVWRDFSPVMKPTGKRGPTLLYKFVSTALGAEMDFDACNNFVANLKNFKTLVGKQMRIGVEVSKKQNGDEKNTTSAFYPVKKELPKYDEKKARGEDDKKKKK